RREIIFILEQDDHATRAAFQRVGGIVGARALVLPPAGPRTKPKALTAALACTAGDYVVVYDAEDLPEPDQLKRAVAAFRDGPTDLACLQARLHVHNGADGWFARHFASEYICLFDALLPAYEAARIPIPLGGTSNHFPRAVLAQLGGWDPHNVTEDADLGVRIARAGLTARMLRSVTYEEAPSRAGDWVGQRSRWLKGWMQTWLVHSRYPLRTARQLGPVRWLIFQLLFGGVIAAALFHPLVYALAAWQVATVGPFAWPDASASMLLTIVSAANLAFGWLSAALLILVAGWRHRQRGSLSLALTLPAYWLAMSWAAWIALAELFTAPFHWRKTRHTARSH
ncbi:MAG: glycosyltransferase family 2 protein, partial [Pseudomonadota bacterium]